MPWLEDLFFFNLRKNILVFNIFFKIPEDDIFSPLRKAKISKDFYLETVSKYREIFNKYLNNIDAVKLKHIIITLRDLINPNIETTYEIADLSELFRYYLSLQFNLYFKYHKIYHLFETQKSESLTKIKNDVRCLIIQKSSEVFRVFKNIVERKYLNTKIEEPLFVDGVVKFNLITESGGSLTYRQLPEPLKQRMKNVLSHAEHNFIINFFKSPKMQDLIRNGRLNLAPDFKEKMISIIETSLEDLQDLNEQVLVKKIEKLFKPNCVKEEDIKYLANNIQSTTIDGRIVMSQVAEVLSNLKNHDLNNLLQTIFDKSNLEDGDLPHFDLTGKEGIFALAMEAITANSTASKNITLNVYGKQPA